MAYLVPVELPTQAGSKLLQKLWSFERAADVAVGVRTTLSRFSSFLCQLFSNLAFVPSLSWQNVRLYQDS
jgi:hypothetical protein